MTLVSIGLDVVVVGVSVVSSLVRISNCPSDVTYPWSCLDDDDVLLFLCALEICSKYPSLPIHRIEYDMLDSNDDDDDDDDDDE